MKTRITGSFRRSIQTAQYFTAEVISGFDEEVEYSNPAELEARRTQLRDKAIAQVVSDLEAFKSALATEGKPAEEKRVFVTDKRKSSNHAALGVDLD